MAKLSRRKLLKLGALGALGLLSIDGLCVEPNWIEVVEIDIPMLGLPNLFNGYRIAQLSDFHYPNYINSAAIQDAFKLAADRKPDLMVLTGDFVHSGDFAHKLGHTVPSLAEPFADLSAPDGVLGVLGNHDHWMDSQAVHHEITTRTNIRLIDSQSVILDREGSKVAIVGSEDLWQGPPQLARLSELPRDMPRILLQQNPDLAEEIKPGYRVDLQLSGHTHGGQVRIPFGPAPIIPSKYGQKFRAGLVEGKMHRVYVNRGIGNSAPFSARLWCRPEITILTLRAA